MRLRELGISSKDQVIFTWQTLEDAPGSFDEFRDRCTKWLDRRGLKLGEGVTYAALKPPYVGEDIIRMEYVLEAPRLSGEYPVIDLIS